MGIDLGSRTAIASGEPNTVPRTWIERVARKDDPGGHAAAVRLSIFLEAVFRSSKKPDLVVLERPWVQGQYANVADLFSCLKAALAIECHRYGITYHMADASSIAKKVLGKGRYTKEQGGRNQKKIDTQDWAMKRGLMDVEDAGDADRADAIAIWWYGCHIVGKVPEAQLFMYGERTVDAEEEVGSELDEPTERQHFNW